MSYLVDIKEELSEQFQKQLRKFRRKGNGTDYSGWYRIQVALARARDDTVFHDKIENYIMPDVFNDEGDIVEWYHWRDPQQRQVNMINKNLARCRTFPYPRSRVSQRRLKFIMLDILKKRIENYTHEMEKKDEKLKIMCIVGGSGTGKTLASLHLKYHKDANVICSFTTRRPRPTEEEGRDHHFIDIVPDRNEMLAYTHFGSNLYYALKCQVFGPCTVYVIDEKGLNNLKADWGDKYRIYTVLIKREKKLRTKMGVDQQRIRRDEWRINIPDEEYDFVVDNNSTKKKFFEQIERIYETIKNY